MRVALTGGIAAGKTFVADELARLGAVIVDSDLLAREVVEPGTAGLAAIVERFGAGMLLTDGSLNREALGNLVFSDPGARAALNAIVHPLVRRRAEELEAAAPEGAVVVSVIPLLVETGLDKGFDTIIVADVPVETQVARLKKRNALTGEEALARIGAQATRERRLAVATHVIDNSGPKEQTWAQIDRVWAELTGRSGDS
ncbi:dephospho-CoA kinase [Tessaracoccus sp. HDW20]|uniref:dephospho-CoA kinase n=1 Tax=Tessaracoccus coleopterorum TaxID=2714950 RepID=UPI0018D3A209|nr:dephospho-CoA kinase [Tessaracoccus coleopterorum]NHB83941.1 dephospho-CoA kinase [Tessaracoccus coleopterorum]